MNERERAEFERHKIRAEEQLNRMYYGTDKKTPKSGNISMPPFLETPKQNQGTKKPSSTNTKSEESAEKSKLFIQNKPLKNSSILNFLNFKGIKMDNDRLIILAICLLLANEDTDELLMLALIYVML